MLEVEEQTLPANPPFIATLSGDGLTGTSWPELMTETDVGFKLATNAAGDAVPFASLHFQRMTYKPLGLNRYSVTAADVLDPEEIYQKKHASAIANLANRLVSQAFDLKPKKKPNHHRSRPSTTGWSGVNTTTCMLQDDADMVSDESEQEECEAVDAWQAAIAAAEAKTRAKRRTLKRRLWRPKSAQKPKRQRNDILAPDAGDHHQDLDAVAQAVPNAPAGTNTVVGVNGRRFSKLHAGHAVAPTGWALTCCYHDKCNRHCDVGKKKPMSDEQCQRRLLAWEEAGRHIIDGSTAIEEHRTLANKLLTWYAS